MWQCPAGRFGCASRLGSPDCNGPCNPGFFCPEGSDSSQVYVQHGFESSSGRVPLGCCLLLRGDGVRALAHVVQAGAASLQGSA
jgi:hypothetical protein